jgi:hypothetical protein
MAATNEGRQLTEAHRLAQNRIAQQIVVRMHEAWVLLDPEDIDATVARWLRVTVPLIQSQRVASAALAGQYMTAYRAAEIGLDGTFTPVLAGPAQVEALTTSLTVTGPVRIKQAMGQGVRFLQAIEAAEVSSTGAAMRHGLNGGRSTITDTIAKDRKALGWARYLRSTKPCAFCALMAARGPVYKSQQSANFEPHDSCKCQPEPTYHPDADWPTGSRRYAEIYDEVAKGLPRKEALAAFRHAIEGG